MKVTDRAAASPLANMKRQTGKPSLPAGRTGGQAELGKISALICHGTYTTLHGKY